MLGGVGTNGSALTSGKRGGLPTSLAFNLNDILERHLTLFNVDLEVAILIIINVKSCSLSCVRDGC